MSDSDKRDSKGKFVKGNTFGKGRALPKEIRELKEATREEVIKCAFSLTRPWSDLKNDLKNKSISRLEYLTAEAVQKGNHRFICWLCEMVIGKPSQQVEINSTNEKPFRIEYMNGMLEELGIKNK